MFLYYQNPSITFLKYKCLKLEKLWTKMAPILWKVFGKHNVFSLINPVYSKNYSR